MSSNCNVLSVGSVCSGIEASSVALTPIGYHIDWVSEIAPFPCAVLKAHYPNVPNIGDMTKIPRLLLDNSISAPDVICGGTPCQAFSYAGLKRGLNDDRGNLTIRFVDIVNANDKVRAEQGKSPTIILWENVEGVLSDKTNAFGCFISALAGLDMVIESPDAKYQTAGVLKGKNRTVAWRVLDAKYFGLPQQRRRLYVIAGGEGFYPESVLFENEIALPRPSYEEQNHTFEKDGHYFEIFREYTDCLYSSYATKWNGNAAAYNGSLYVVQDGRLRRLSNVECERLQGFPDGYTDIKGAKRTLRYNVIGNSWAIPVIQWLGQRIIDYGHIPINGLTLINGCQIDIRGQVSAELNINVTDCPSKPKKGEIQCIIEVTNEEKIFLSPIACAGILRRKNERKLHMNKQLEQILTVQANHS